jgi:hypothetical protein
MLLEAQGHCSYASHVEEKERILQIITKRILVYGVKCLLVKTQTP